MRSPVYIGNLHIIAKPHDLRESSSKCEAQNSVRTVTEVRSLEIVGNLHIITKPGGRFHGTRIYIVCTREPSSDFEVLRGFEERARERDTSDAAMATMIGIRTKKEQKLNNKLAHYLGWNMTMDELLELWEKVDRNFLSADELGIADYMVFALGSDVILDALSAPLIEKLASEDKREQQDAINTMREMGYDMTKLGYKR